MTGMTRDQLVESFRAWLHDNLMAQHARFQVEVREGVVTLTHEERTTEALVEPEAAG